MSGLIDHSAPLVKICGINTVDTLNASIQAGASMIGFVFYDASPRAISAERAADLIRDLPTDVKSVGLFVDPDEAWLEQILANVPIDIIQLHGSETPERVSDIKAYYPLPVIKAIKVGTEEDLEQVLHYRHCADIILLDAKPPSNVTTMLPGGNGIAFDWSMLSEVEIPGPWMLSGGLNPENVAEAIDTTHARFVDVSSGVEDAPGHKSVEKIQDFMTEVRAVYI